MAIDLCCSINCIASSLSDIWTWTFFNHNVKYSLIRYMFSSFKSKKIVSKQEISTYFLSSLMYYITISTCIREFQDRCITRKYMVLQNIIYQFVQLCLPVFNFFYSGIDWNIKTTQNNWLFSVYSELSLNIVPWYVWFLVSL